MENILQVLTLERKASILNSLPQNSLYYNYLDVLLKNPNLSNGEYAALIGLKKNMNEFYQIKHQTKEMIEDRLFQDLIIDHVKSSKELKYTLLSKFYFGKADHELGKSYLSKALSKDINPSLQGFQLDIMNGLFLEVTERYDEGNLELIDQYESLNDGFHGQTSQYIILAKKLHSLINPSGSKNDTSPKSLMKDLNEINLILDKLPMDAGIFKLEYRFAEIYLRQNQQVGQEFLDFYIQLFHKWNEEGYFTERNHDLKLKSMVNISFLLLSNHKFELGKSFLDALHVDIAKFGKAFKQTHKIYYVTFLSYYYYCQKDFAKSLQLLLKFEKNIRKNPLQKQTLYFFYQSLARVLYFNDEIEKCIDVLTEINQLAYKQFLSPSRKINWSIFEFLCHYRLRNYTYCKNVLQKIRTNIRKSGNKKLKANDVEYFKAIVKIYNAMLRNVGYLENLDLTPLLQLNPKEKGGSLFYDKIIPVAECFLALK